MSSPPASGGFILPSAPSPPPSSAASSTTAAATLPSPRSKPLKTGGPKESAFIRYVDDHVRQIQRRFAKRGTESTIVADVKGYESFGEASEDIEQLVDVVWVSGTPSLQIAYLLSLSDLLNTFMTGFPPAPKALFRTLGKLDYAFASLLQGRDIETAEELPGFQGGRGVNATEKVRIYGMLQHARTTVVAVMAKYEPGAGDDEDETAGETMDDDTTAATDLDVDEEFGRHDFLEGTWDMQVAKVYDKTVVELGDSLTNAPPVGMRIDK